MTDYERFSQEEAGSEAGGRLGAALTFLFVGLGIGAITALLLAPKTGRQMRRKLKRRYEDARERFDDWGEQAGDVVERGSKWAKDAKSRMAPLKKRFMD